MESVDALVGAAAVAPDASEGAWPCPKCTYLNGADTTLCALCEQGRLHTGNGKGKGRAGLRSRSTRCSRATPSKMPSLADSSMEEAAERDEEEEDADDFEVPTNSSASKKSSRGVRRSKRARTVETNAVENGNAAAAAAPGYEPGGFKVAVEVGPATEAVTGDQHLLVELDDSDQGEGAKDEFGTLSVRDGSDEDEGRDDDDNLAGETPSLLGRGWSAEDRRRAEEHKERARALDLSISCGDVEVIGAGVGGRKRRGATPARRGGKRVRPPSPSPWDDIFRARKYPLAEDEESAGSDKDDKPLVVRRRNVVSGGRERTFWRWPPPPLPGEVTVYRACSIAGSFAGDGVAAGDECPRSGESEEHHSHNEPNCEAGEDHDGGKRDEGSSSRGNSWRAPSLAATMPNEFSEQHGQRPKRRRSRLSLPKREKDDRSEAAPAPAAAASPTEDRALHRPSPQLISTSATDVARAVEKRDEELNVNASHAKKPEGCDGRGVSSRKGKSKRKEESSPDLRGIVVGEDSGANGSKSKDRCDRGQRTEKITGGEKEGNGGALVNREVERFGDDGASGRRGLDSPPKTSIGNDTNRIEETKSERGTLGVREPPVEASATVDADKGAGAVGSFSRISKVMSYDMGSDDGSEDSDETQGKSVDPGRKPRHLGRAMDEAVENTTAPLSSSSPSPSSAVAEAVSSETNSVCPTPGLKTPSKKPGEDEGRPSFKKSPDPLSMDLIDTPPQPTIKTEDKQSTAGKASLRKLRLSRASREAEMLAETSPSVAAPREQWTCSRCTLLNRARALMCDACHAEKPSFLPKLMRRAGSTDTGEMMVDRCESDDDPGAGYVEDEDGFSYEDPPVDASMAGDSESPISNSSGAERWRVGPRAHSNTPDDRGKVERNTAGNRRASLETAAAAGKRRGAGARGVEVATSNREVLGAGSDGNDYAGLEWGWEGNADEGDSDDNYYEENDDDEDYVDAEGDEPAEGREMTGSSIEERFLQSSQHAPGQSVPLPSKRKRQQGDTPGRELKEICDLTDMVEVGDLIEGEGNAAVHESKRGKALGGERQDTGARAMIEEISEFDDYDNVGDVLPVEPGSLQRPLASGDHSENPSSRRRFRFFSSVSQHCEANSSCVGFAQAAAPSAGATGAKSYVARRKLREAKASRSKRGRGKKAKEPAASSRARGAAGRGGKVKGRGKRAENRDATRSFVQPFGGGRGGVPSASWIPTDVAAGLSSSTGGKRDQEQRRPFNHYRGNDDMVDDLEAGGGVGWEGAGRINLGGE